MDRSFFYRLSSVARDAIADCRDPASTNKAGEGDYDPVTEADEAAELAMRALIEAEFPEHGIWGEEFGWTREDAACHWSLDPIDGTRAFICNLPSWSILVGYLEDGRHVAGMIDLPALGETIVSTQKGAMTKDDKTLRVSGCASLADARLSTTDIGLFRADDRDAFERLAASTKLVRYGLDALAYARLASGGLDLIVETGLKKHDYDALVPVVSGSGGKIGNWSGESDLSGGDVIAASSEALYEEAVLLLAAR